MTSHPALLAALALLPACAPVPSDLLPPSVDAPTRYAFDSRFLDGSSVSYSGQTLRQALLVGLEDRIEGLTARIDGGWVPAEGEVVAELMAFYAFDSQGAGGRAHGVPTDPPPVQQTWDDIASGKDLRGKVAGNDPVGHHLDYAGGVVGWDDPAVDSPDALILSWFDRIEELCLARANGATPSGPDGAPVSVVTVTPEGQDLRELVAKFVAMSVSFSQATDDYLDDDLEGKGLNSDAERAEDDEGFTALEHAWDEAFGYFGATRDYGEYSDDELASAGGREGWRGMHDSDGDGAIDLRSERLFGHAINAGKRDRGAVEPADFSQDAWDGFLGGRALIAAAAGPLDEAQRAELGALRDQAVGAWEGAIAATAVHYINRVLQDMSAFGTEDYDFSAHAGHFSELKGFTLGLDFNPRSPLSGELAAFHALIGQSPALPDDAPEVIAAYRGSLLAARDLLGEAYAFDPANLGGDDGRLGW